MKPGSYDNVLSFELKKKCLHCQVRIHSKCRGPLDFLSWPPGTAFLNPSPKPEVPNPSPQTQPRPPKSDARPKLLARLIHRTCCCIWRQCFPFLQLRIARVTVWAASGVEAVENPGGAGSATTTITATFFPATDSRTMFQFQ